VFARIQALSSSGRLTLRERALTVDAGEAVDQTAQDAIPDIAMPDPHDR
jgi:hypothetical protein